MLVFQRSLRALWITKNPVFSIYALLNLYVIFFLFQFFQCFQFFSIIPGYDHKPEEMFEGSESIWDLLCKATIICKVVHVQHKNDFKTYLLEKAWDKHRKVQNTMRSLFINFIYSIFLKF